MLVLENIKKNYVAGENITEALKGISINFRKSEFVSVLGPSGCGKTTFLNVIGGLDRYDSGKLTVNGVPTEDFKDSDWDAYRNHSVGFVFQSYNLIPHQTVISNVELALTLTGVSKHERRRKAMAALEKVGIADQAKKKPNQLSGGQMQRVAIARALVNDPEILLADEPTGALDSETSIQIMDLLKEVSNSRLVIMVTHNPKLAEQYSTRTVTLLDGQVTSDTNPYPIEEEKKEYANIPEETDKKGKKKKKKDSKNKKPSMSFFTAMSLSLNNLMTKKARTILTSFAGSIGIIGIALILSMSNGFQLYIDKVQEDTLSTYPITIEQQNVDMNKLMAEMMDKAPVTEGRELDKVYTNTIMTQMLDTMKNQMQKNDLTTFMQYIEDNREQLKEFTTDIKYSYGVDFNIYSSDISKGPVKVNPSTILGDIYGMDTNGNGVFGSMGQSYMKTDVWSELIDNQKLLESQYDTLYGHWPTNKNEAVLFVNKNNAISDFVLYALGIKDQSELEELVSDSMLGKEPKPVEETYSYEELCNLKFSLVLAADYYQYDPVTHTYRDMSDDTDYVKSLVENGEEIKIVGIMRPKPSAAATSFAGTIGYTHELTDYYLEETAKRDVVIAQRSNEINKIASEKYGRPLKNSEVDIFTGIPFGHKPSGETPKITIEDVRNYISTLPSEEQIKINAAIKDMPDEQVIKMFADKISTTSKVTKATLESNLQKLGAAVKSTPSSIGFYAVDFESKDRISEFIDGYNDMMKEKGQDGKVIGYTDYIGIMMSSVSTIIDTVSYVLIAFVAISLIVSSIMIGIITYISVLERTKEIGILRSIGAKKKDISRVFNAETLIIGFISGMFGVVATLLLNIPINLIIRSLGNIENVARLPVLGMVILMAISMLLTLIAGFIPSRMAAKKDPVVALRTE